MQKIQSIAGKLFKLKIIETDYEAMEMKSLEIGLLIREQLAKIANSIDGCSTLAQAQQKLLTQCDPRDKEFLT